jgi:hypothetical protein
MNSLVKFEAARRALAEAKTIDEVKDIRDKAEALRLYVKQQGESLEMQNDIAEIKLRAERRAGKLLAEMAENGQRKTPQTAAEKSSRTTLLDMGIRKDQSSDWQRIAAMPEETFETVIEKTKSNGDELTSAGMLRVAKSQAREQNRQSEIEHGLQVEIDPLAVQLYTGDFREVYIDSQSIDVILTDPPYPYEYLSLYGDLAQKAACWLKPGGTLAVMCGQSYLPEIYALMTPHLNYHWTLAYLTPGGQAVQIWPRKINTFWKPILWFVNGDYNGQWIGDVASSKVNDNDKRFHDWGQSISGMNDLVDRLSKPGDVILDPFMGSGSTGVATLLLNRQFIGIDIDPDNVNIARSRIAQVNNGCSE